MMEKLAVEFRHDPLTFCWLDLDVLPPQQAKQWQAQLKASANRTLSSMNRLMHPQQTELSWHSCDCPAFVVALSNKGKKISVLPTGTAKLELESVQKWIVRLVGGEISQEESIAGLFE